MARHKVTPARTCYRAAIDEHVAPFLEGLGFRRRPDDEFERVAGTVVCTCSAGVTVAPDGEFAIVQVGVGVGHRDLADFLRGFPDLTDHLPRRAVIGIGGLVTRLPPRYPTLTWEIRSGTSAAALAGEVIDCLKARAVPLWEGGADRTYLIRAWADPDHPFVFDGRQYNLAAARWLEGDRRGAIAAARELIAQFEGEAKAGRKVTEQLEKARRFEAYLRSLA